MKIVFLSNYLNHHQLPFCLEMQQKNNVEFYFVATIKTPEVRINLGYEDMNSKYGFVVEAYKNDDSHKKAMLLCREADVVVTGSAPDIYIKERLRGGKLTFRYSERLYKKKKPFYLMPLVAVKRFWQNGRYKNLYLLCSSAFTAMDFAKTGTFINKTYKWGYFPQTKEYEDIDRLVSQKRKNSILWVGRIIDWKHPEYAIKVAQRLKNDGYDFELNIIGSGDMEEQIKELINNSALEDRVHMLGSMPAQKVREYMEQAQIFLFTSDRNEGWGAVLNEAMNSACAVVASSMIGSVPFLINNGENGLIYKDGNTPNLYKNVKFLIDNVPKTKAMGISAYKTLRNQWNAENAVDRLIQLADAILSGNKNPDIFENGVCSRAERLKDNWYQ